VSDERPCPEPAGSFEYRRVRPFRLGPTERRIVGRDSRELYERLRFGQPRAEASRGGECGRGRAGSRREVAEEHQPGCGPRAEQTRDGSPIEEARCQQLSSPLAVAGERERKAEQRRRGRLDVGDTVVPQDTKASLEQRNCTAGVTLVGVESTERVEAFGEAQWVIRSLGDLHRLSRMTLRSTEIAGRGERAGKIHERGDNGPALRLCDGCLEPDERIAQPALQPARDPEMEIGFDFEFGIAGALREREPALRAL
jgi:hypothetical protein